MKFTLDVVCAQHQSQGKLWQQTPAPSQFTRLMQKSMTSISADFCGVAFQRRQCVAGDLAEMAGAADRVGDGAVAGHQADRLFQRRRRRSTLSSMARFQKARSALVPRR